MGSRGRGESIRQVHDIDQLLSEIVSLPSLPRTVSRGLQVLKDEESTLADVAELLATDPALAMKLLRLANSAYFGIKQEVRSVEHAVPLLGRRVVRNLVISATVFDRFAKNTYSFMRYSVATGMGMEILARISPNASLEADEAFVYGILHNVGMLVLAEYLPNDNEQARVVSAGREIPLVEAERQVIGADHALIGARLCTHWHLPSQFSEAIAGYRQPATCETEASKPIAALLGVAAHICVQAGLGDDPRDLMRLTPEHWEYSRLGSHDVMRATGEFFDALPGVNELVAACA